MTPAVIGLLVGTGGLGAVVAALITYFGVRGANRNRAIELEQTADGARFADNLELATYVDGRIEAALAPHVEKITALEEALAAVQKRERSLKDIVRRWFQRLTFWDENGRVGEMPVPPSEDMHTLELADLVEPANRTTHHQEGTS